MRTKLNPFVAALAIGLLSLLTSCSPSSSRPNILLITLDTTRADHLSCYGYFRKTTPNLDQLAAEGQRFENALAVSSWTLPTHASLFTGLFPITHGAHYSDKGRVTLSEAVEVGRKELYDTFRANGLSAESTTLAEMLKAEGYATGGIGAGPWMNPVFGLDQGFDYYDCDVNSTWGRRADEVTALGQHFIKGLERGPFFLFLNYFDPHGPYTPPKSCALQFKDEAFMARAKSDPSLKREYETCLYDGEIFFMDKQIGYMLDTLKERGLYDDTWIIVLGDHGELFGEHGLEKHGYSLYEGEVAMPLIIKWPEGWAPCRNTDARYQQVDIVPTIAERLGLESPPAFEGEPLDRLTHPAVCELYRNQGNVTTKGERFDRSLTALYADQYKLILSTKEEDRDAGLFDLAADPAEEEDIAASRPQLAEALRTLLDQWRASCLNPLTPKQIDAIDPETQRQLEALGYGK
jgi:arylsulfatase A-like enzyme